MVPPSSNPYPDSSRSKRWHRNTIIRTAVLAASTVAMTDIGITIRIDVDNAVANTINYAAASRNMYSN